MPRGIREGWRTIAWLTLYVGWLPVASTWLIAALCRLAGAEHDDWFILICAVYFCSLYAGANLFARHFERHSS
jgi:hypothetical protein